MEQQYIWIALGFIAILIGIVGTIRALENRNQH